METKKTLELWKSRRQFWKNLKALKHQLHKNDIFTIDSFVLFILPDYSFEKREWTWPLLQLEAMKNSNLGSRGTYF